MAIKALSWMVRIFPPPIYCYHEIVHNQTVVESFKAKGVVFVNDVNEVPPNSPLMLSAHGTAPDVEKDAALNGRVVVNAVCPLVTKVHHEVQVRANKGYTIIYVGHVGHEEAVGTMAVAPQAVHLVEKPEDLAYIDFTSDTKAALLAQTTLSQDEWQSVLEKAREIQPELWMPGRGDLCFATTNRQAALRSIATRADSVVVVGSANSSNTVALTKVAISMGAARVLRINSAEELPDDLFGTVGVTAGASAPEDLVQEVIAKLSPTEGVEEVKVTLEDEYFPPPRQLRELLRSTAGALHLGTMSDGAQLSPLGDDRQRPASDTLAALSHQGTYS